VISTHHPGFAVGDHVYGGFGVIRRALREYAPGGVDVFLDNVGGEILDAVLTRLARGARIVLSGGVSQYNAQQARGPANYVELIAARASMTGMFTPTTPTATPRPRPSSPGGCARAG
jgi:NADPH-dependent curcumin reductase CurA